MKVVITGSTGMIGKGVLLECLDDPRIQEVVIVNRSHLDIVDHKITQILCTDWFDLTDVTPYLSDVDACFFCLGATITTLSESDYHRICYDLTMVFAETLLKENPQLTFCYVSGMGVDGTKLNPPMWVRIKGQTEQALLNSGIPSPYMIRPGYIQPMRGTRSKTIPYRLFYMLFSPFYGLIKRLMPRFSTTTVAIGRAMIALAHHGYTSPFIENSDINKLAKTHEGDANDC